MRSLVPIVLVPLGLGLLGADQCHTGGGGPPAVSVTLDGIPDAMNGLLVVPPSGFVVNASFQATAVAVDPASLFVAGYRWGGETLPPLQALFSAGAAGAQAEIPPGFFATPGTYTVVASIADVDGRVGYDTIDFAVRGFPGTTPPIGTGQQIWFDFLADRDAVGGPDLDVDLQHFGLGSPAEPSASQLARDLVVERVLARVRQAYDQDGSGLDGPVAVTFTDQQPAAGDVTRICVGGEDPAGGATIGSILIDPNNANRNSVECGTVPPTGVFPRELLVWANASSFREVFDPLRPAAGGTPVGEYAWDVFILLPGFDPGSAPPEIAARYAVVHEAIDVFGDALGSIVAHETAHALGLVPPGPPGGGLFGGSDGPAYSHALQPDGSTPPENLLMKAGNTFSFSRLAGLGSYSLPSFRAIELAYLHDRLVLAPQVTQLLPPPKLLGVTPWQLSGSSQLVTVLGSGFAPIPAIRLVNPSYAYGALGEAWQSAEQATCWVVPAQLPAGTYDLELTNPDGQKAVLPASIQVD
jgi:hypothetical protein